MPWGGEYLHELFEISSACDICLFSRIYFSHLFVSIMTHEYLFYTLS